MEKKGIGVLKYRCRYPNCKNKYYSPIYEKDFYNKRFYRFPRCGKVLRAWKDVCKIEHSVTTDNYCICEDHFNPGDFVNFSKSKLNSGVVPINPQVHSIYKDHDYTLIGNINNGGVNTVEAADKYTFLLENDEELDVIASLLESSLHKEKAAMLIIHQAIVWNLLQLRQILNAEKYILQKLIELFEEGKFDILNKEIACLPYEFVETQLEDTSLMMQNYVEEECLLALFLYIKNRKLYKYLCTYFYVPPVKILRNLLYTIPFKIGVNNEVVNQMKNNVVNMHNESRICVLMIGEVHLKSHLHYDEIHQQFCGYEDLDVLGKSLKLADHALILMVKGLGRNWKQVISYFFSSGPMKHENLRKIIAITIQKLQEMGLVVAALVCEPTSTNLDALSLLCPRVHNHVNLSYFLVNGKRICVVYSAPYLLMETRNALAKCKILYDKKPNKFAKLEHIQVAYNIDQSKRIYKQLYKLQDHYFDVSPLNCKTYKSAAPAIFSHTVAASIETCVLCKYLPEEAINTAEFVEMMDIFYDSLTGSEEDPPDHKKYRCCLSKNSPHFELWTSISTEMNNWTLLDLKSEEDVTDNYHFIKCWQATIESLFYMWKHYYFKSLRWFSLEPLENLFEDMSQYATDEELTCQQFIEALKCELIHKHCKSSSTVACRDLVSLKELTTNLFDGDASNICNSKSGTFFDALNLDIVLKLDPQKAAAYLSGYILQKMDIPRCNSCRSYLLADWILCGTTNVPLSECGNDYSLYASDLVIRTVNKLLYLLCDFLTNSSEGAYLEDVFKALHVDEIQSFQFCYVHNSNEILIDLCIKLGIYKFMYCLNKR